MCMQIQIFVSGIEIDMLWDIYLSLYKGYIMHCSNVIYASDIGNWCSRGDKGCLKMLLVCRNSCLYVEIVACM